MDEHVLAAMARWPDVPDVYGWLSLSFQGQWRLHPDGQGNDVTNGSPTFYPAGEPISNEQILNFINRNYGHDDEGRWFFQNGPQRVFVRLDAAPFILHTQGAGQDITLLTHNGRPVTRISAWALDAMGRLFATTEHGAGLISSRDLETILGQLSSAGQPLEEILGRAMPPELEPASFQARADERKRGDKTVCLSVEFKALPTAEPAPLRYCAATDIPGILGFVPNPQQIASKK